MLVNKQRDMHTVQRHIGYCYYRTRNQTFHENEKYVLRGSRKRAFYY